MSGTGEAEVQEGYERLAAGQHLRVLQRGEERARLIGGCRGVVLEPRRLHSSRIATARQSAASPPWKRHGKQPELDLLVQHLVDLAAQVLDVDDVVREEQRVHDLVVGLGEDLVKAPTQLLLRLLGLVGADAPDHGVHRMVGAAGVDRDPAHAALHHPLGECAGRPGMPDEIGGLVRLRAIHPVLGIELVVARVDDEDVAALDAEAGFLLPALEVLGSVEVVITDAHLLEVDDAGRAGEEIQGQIADELATRHEMRGRVQMRADVQRHRDLLSAGAVEGEVLDPPDGGAGVAGERRRVQ